MSTQQVPEKSLEALQKQKKTLATLLISLVIIMVAYLAFFVWSLYSGTWQANNTFGVSGIGFLVIMNAVIATRFGVVNKEIKNRETA